jgi:hypothetical protein
MVAYAFEQKISNLIKDAVLLNVRFLTGSTGAVTGTQGSGITSVTRLGVGIYRILLDREYNRLMHAHFDVRAGVAGGAVNDGSLNPTTLYSIQVVGTSDFTASGARKNVVGECFVASGAGGAGSGNCKAVLQSQAVSVQVCRESEDSPDHIVIQCVDDAGAAVESESGNVISGIILLRRSSVVGEGE